jgi:hypothetical protein
MKYTNGKIQEIALSFKTRNDFRVQNPSAYNAARRLNILDEVCSHMDGKYSCNTKYSNEDLVKIASQYTSVNQLYTSNKKIYETMRRRKLLSAFKQSLKEKVTTEPTGVCE